MLQPTLFAIKTDEQQQRHSKEGGEPPGGSLPTSQAVIMSGQPSLKIPNKTNTHGHDDNVYKTNVGTRGTACKCGKGGSAHGDGSDGVCAVLEEVLKTKTDEQQQCHSKEGGKRRADPCQQVKRLSWRLNHPSKVNCVNNDATIVSPQVSLGRNYQELVCKQELWGEDAGDKPQTSYDSAWSSMVPGS